MKKTSTVQLVRNATLKIRYAGHTMLIDPVFSRQRHFDIGPRCE